MVANWKGVNEKLLGRFEGTYLKVLPWIKQSMLCFNLPKFNHLGDIRGRSRCKTFD